MRTRLRLRALILAISLASLFAVAIGCGGSSNEPEQTSSSGALQEDVSGKLVVWDQFYNSALPDYMKAVDQIDEAFEKRYPDVTVEHVGQTNYDQVLQAAFAARSGPDIMTVNSGATGVLRWAPGLKELDPLITDDMREHISQWYVGAEDYDPEKTIYGIPFGIQASVFYYNKQLFEQAGLDPSNPPTTVAEVADACKKLKSAGIVPIGGGGKDGLENTWWFSALFAAIGTEADTAGLTSGELPWTSEQVKTALETQKSLHEAGCFASDYFAKPFLPDGINTFAGGKAGMYLGLASGNAYYGNFNPKLGVENVGVFQVPGVDAPQPNYLPVGSLATLAIPKFSKNPDAAWAYAEFFTGKEGAQTLYDVFDVMPNNDEVVISDNAPPQLTTMLEAFRTGPTFLQADRAMRGGVTAEYLAKVNEYLQDKLSLEDLLNALQKAQSRS